MALIHPDGTEIILSDHNGNGSHRDGSEVWGEGSRSCNGDLAYFFSTASQSIIDRSKPFTGFSRPVEDLSSLNGKDAAGDWTLRIVDGWAQDDGELFCAQLLLSTSEPETTEIIDPSANMEAEAATWDLPDPFTFFWDLRIQLWANFIGASIWRLLCPNRTSVSSLSNKCDKNRQPNHCQLGKR